MINAVGKNVVGIGIETIGVGEGEAGWYEMILVRRVEGASHVGILEKYPIC